MVILTIAFYLLIGLVLGVFVFVVFGMLWVRSNEDREAELISENTTYRMERNAELIRLLYCIGKPDLPSGHYSEEKQRLWDKYSLLECEHNRLTKQEHEQESNVRYGG